MTAADVAVTDGLRGGHVTVVALVPAKDRADRVGATVTALLGIARVTRVVVVDDGSADDTTEVARAAGADVVSLPRNLGKGAAVAAGVAATPDADVYLLIDADLATTASAADLLLDPVLDGTADMTVGVLPAAGSRAGFGAVKRLARRGIERACGFRAEAPLSGQRAVRAALLRDLHSAERFGLEVAMTVDVVRAGGVVVEVPVPMDHRHTGRSFAGFVHRGRQGSDIVRALWPRVVKPRLRHTVAVVIALAAVAAMLVISASSVPSSEAASSEPSRVVLVGVPHLGLEDIGVGRVPVIDGLIERGAFASMSVRTLSPRPAAIEAYASIGAGTRVAASVSTGAAYRFDERLEGSTAADVTHRRTGVRPDGQTVVPAIGAAIEGAGRDVSSDPGALGAALDKAGIRTAAVGASDSVDTSGGLLLLRPPAMAVVDTTGNVDLGSVHGRTVLEEDEASPYGMRADHAVLLDETRTAVAGGARFLVIDPGDTSRAVQYRAYTSEDRVEELRLEALARTDDLVGELVETLPEDTLLLVAGVTPPALDWELTPVVAVGPGVPAGYLHSTSTKRLGLVTLTDLSTTILDALDVDVPDGMIGAPLRYREGEVDLDSLIAENDTATGREEVYYPITLTFIVVQALAYLLAILILSQRQGSAASGRFLRVLVLTFACWPLGTFVLRLFPSLYDLGAWSHVVLWMLALLFALGFSRSRRFPLSPLAWICGVTAVILVADVAFGARLQMSSILGYSPHTAARFTGYGNTAFAVLAATSVIAAVLHIHHAPRFRDAWLTSALFLGVVVIADGAPTLGADVGGMLTLVPVFGLVLYATSGRRVTARTVVVAVVVTVVVVGLVAAIDLARGPGNRTHLGDFVAGIFDGEGTFWTTISRKWATNLRVFQNSVWTWMVPIIAVFMIYVLVIARGWRQLLPERSVLRIGVAGTVVAGLLGWLVNDSGVVVAALVFVYIGPYLTLLTLDREQGEPELLPGLPAPPEPEPDADAEPLGEAARQPAPVA